MAHRLCIGCRTAVSANIHPDILHAQQSPGESQLGALRHHGDRDVRAEDADHAVNVVAGNPPAWLAETLQRALQDDVGRYPDERAAMDALATLHGREGSEIVPTNGAAEALWLIPSAIAPRLAVCVHPGFTEAEAALRAHGVHVQRVMREASSDFALQAQDVPEQADLVVVGNPASPSGTLDAAESILALRRPGRTVVVDEAFMEFVPGQSETLIRKQLTDVMVVRSLTKILGVPGLRVGYAVAHAELADRLRAVRPPWAANALALTTLLAATSHPGELATIAARAADEREDLAAQLAKVDGLRVWPSAANFCLVEVPEGRAVVAALRQRAIAVRPAESFPGLGPDHIRITARSAQENGLLADALQEAIRACQTV